MRRRMMFKTTPSVFVPERFDVTAPSYYQSNRNFVIKAYTSIPVEGDPSKTVDKVILLDSTGNEIGLFNWVNTNAVANGIDDYCYYTKTHKETIKLESYSYQIVAINGNGLQSKPIWIEIPIKS